MAAERERSGRLLGLFGVGMAVCCGLPIMLGTGIALGAAGIAAGSSLVVVVAAAAAVAWSLRRRRNARCEAPLRRR